SAAGPFALVLRTAREVRATMPLLRRAPFCPPSTWRAVEGEGDTTGEVGLRFVPPDPGRDRVGLSPPDTKGYVPSVDLTAGAAGAVPAADRTVPGVGRPRLPLRAGQGIVGPANRRPSAAGWPPKPV